LKQKNKKILKIVGLTACSFALAAAVFYITYYVCLSKSLDAYEKPIKDYISAISEINNSTSSFIKSNKLDSEKAGKELTNKIDSLTKIKKSVTELIPTDKYNVSHNSLLSGLENNIMIFRQINEIVKNPQAKDIEKALEDLKKYEYDCRAYYSKVSIKGTQLSLGDTCINFIESTNAYAAQQVNLRKDKEILQGQSLEFINSLDSLLSIFTPINVDLYPNVVNARGNSFDDVVLQIKKNKEAFSSLKESFGTLTVPSKGIDIYKALTKVIEDYDSYIQSLSYAVDVEKLDGEGSKSLTDTELTQLYSTANTKFADVTTNYEKFLKLYTELKDAVSTQ